MRRLYAQLALALVLVFAQQCAVAHLISHAAQQNSRQDTTHNTAKACAKCLTAAHLGSAVGSTAPLPLAKLRLPAPRAVDIVTARVRFVHAYRSRAPPTIL
jgi:hypothetical protein